MTSGADLIESMSSHTGEWDDRDFRCRTRDRKWAYGPKVWGSLKDLLGSVSRADCRGKAFVQSGFFVVL